MAKGLYDVTMAWGSTDRFGVYAWAETESEAIRLALRAFEGAGWGLSAEAVSARLLFCEDAAPFSTLPTAGGYWAQHEPEESDGEEQEQGE